MPSAKSNKIFYLEMHSQHALTPSENVKGLQISVVNPPDALINRRFYLEIGAQWKWEDRLSWSMEEWCNYIHQDKITTGIATWEGQEIGFFELEKQQNGNVEILYFGLLNAYLGKGLGGPMLTEVIRHAWSLPKIKRVWLHTCIHDHKYALANYQARGFKLYKTETFT